MVWAMAGDPHFVGPPDAEGGELLRHRRGSGVMAEGRLSCARGGMPWDLGPISCVGPKSYVVEDRGVPQSRQSNGALPKWPAYTAKGREQGARTAIVSPTVIGIVVFACTFGGALAGMRLRAILPEAHLRDESRDTIRVGIGLIATMTALVLGLVTASAKSSFDALDTTIKHAAANVLSLDRALARYGPETARIREALKRVVADRIDTIWPRGQSGQAQPDPWHGTRQVELLEGQIRALTPQTDEQRWLQSRALNLGEAQLEARWMVFSGLGTSVSAPFLVILVSWLTITFVSFGLFAPQNATVVSILFVCALSVAGAIFLILEMDGPFEGLITVSADPLRYAVAHMNQ
jgi:hypothetical protein